MEEGWSSIVWTLPMAEVAEMLALERDAFHAALGKAFDFRLGRVVDSERREAWPLTRLHADHYVGERVALIGDANAPGPIAWTAAAGKTARCMSRGRVSVDLPGAAAAGSA